MNSNKLGRRHAGLLGIAATCGRLALVLTAVPLVACCGQKQVPQSVRDYAAELPARANGQYALLDEAVMKQLVLKDSTLQCAIDVNDGTAEEASNACKCSKSASDKWTDDCKEWLGDHVPAPPAPAAPQPAPMPPS